MYHRLLVALVLVMFVLAACVAPAPTPMPTTTPTATQALAQTPSPTPEPELLITLGDSTATLGTLEFGPRYEGLPYINIYPGDTLNDVFVARFVDDTSWLATSPGETCTGDEETDSPIVGWQWSDIHPTKGKKAAVFGIYAGTETLWDPLILGECQFEGQVIFYRGNDYKTYQVFNVSFPVDVETRGYGEDYVTHPDDSDNGTPNP
jgi:hypothetical protein